MDIDAEVEIPVELGLQAQHEDIKLEIVDLSPETFQERLALARKILAYNRAVRKRCKKKGVAFGDENTPYHIWDIDLKKVIGG